MTTVIDERVVEMKFNNADFEKNVAQSMATLENLKKSLNFDTGKSLEELGKATKNFTLTGMTETISEATTKFSALEIAGVTAIAKITSEAMDFGAKFVKSLSIDQVSTGFQKYAEKTTAVQTIMAATSKSIEEVEAQMEKLNWFTDETSYNFVDMSNNIGKFTSNGVELGKAASAMQGIAAWTARSGQNATTAGRAMYNFSQALGSGAMMVKDWMSIEQANMATVEFKQTAIDTAVELGRLTKVSEGLYKTLDGKTTVSINEFRDSLKKKWFDTDVMIATLNKYNSYTEELYALSEKTGRTATQLMIDAEKYAKGTLDIQEVSESSKVSIKELSEAYESLNSETNKLSREAFKNAQEAKTFMEVMDATADAVSTSWMNTFQLLFGNYEEAKALWTGLANDLVAAFTETGTVRNEVLEEWKQLGGRDSLIMGVVDAVNLLVKPLSAVKQAFADMFPGIKGMGEGLKNITDNFASLMERLQPSEGMLKDIYLTFRGIFTIGKMLINVFTSVIKAVAPITRPFGSLLEMILHFTGYIGASIIVISEFIEKNGLLKGMIDVIALAFSSLFNVIKSGVMIFGGAIVGTIVTVVSLLTKGASAIYKFVTKAKILERIVNKVSSGFQKLTGFLSKFFRATEKTSTKVVKLQNYLAGNNEVIAESGTLTRKATEEVKKSTNILDKFLKVLKTIGTIVGGVVFTLITAIKTIATNIFNFFKKFKTNFTEAKKDAKNFGEVIKAFFKTLFEMFGDLGTKIGEFFESLGINTEGVKTTIDTITKAIGNLLSKVDTGKIAAIAMAAALLALVGAFVKVADSVKSALGAISGVFNNVNKILKKQFMKSSVITDLAKAFAIMAGSLVLLTFVDQPKLLSVGDVMTKLMIAFTACALALKVLDNMLIKNTLKSRIKGIDSSIINLAASFAILAGVLALLNKVELKGGIKEWAAKLGIILVMMAEVTTATIVISKLAPALSKGAILMLAVAASMKMLVDSLVTISGSNVQDITDRLGEFTVLFVGLSAIIAAAGQLKLTSALSLILVAKAINMMWPELTSLAKTIAGSNFGPLAEAANNVLNSVKNFYHNLKDTLGDVWGNLIFIASTIGGIWTIIKLLTVMLPGLKDIGAFVASLGAAAAGFGIGFLALAKAFEVMSEATKSMTTEQFDQIKGVLLGFGALMGIIIGVTQILGVVSNVMGKKILKWTDNLQVNFFAVAAAFVGIGVASILLAKSLDILANNVSPEKLLGPTVAISALLGFLAIAAVGAGTITKAMPVLAGLTAVITAVAVLIAELVILSTLIKDQTSLVIPLAAMIGVMGMLALVCSQIAKIHVKQALSVIGMIISVAGGIVGIGITLKLLSTIPWTSLTKALGAAAASMVGLYFLLKKLTNIAKEISLPRVKNMAFLMGATVGSIVMLGGELLVLSSIDFGKIITGVVGMASIMGGLYLLLLGLEKLSKKISIANVRNIAGLMIAAVGSLVVLGTELWALSTIKSEDLWKAVGVMSVMTLVVSAFAGLMAVIQGVLFSTTAGAGNALLTAFIYSLAAAFIAFGAALALASVGFYAGAKAIEVLIPPIKELAGLVSDDPDLHGKLSLLALSLASLGVGLGVFGVGGAVGAVAIALLAASLKLLQPAVNAINTDLVTLSGVNFVAISDGLVELAKAGIILGFGAGGVKDYSLALEQLTKAIGNFDSGVKSTNPSKTVETMYQGIDGTIVTQTSVVSQKAYASGEEIGDAVSGGVLSKEGDIKQAEKKAIDPLLNGVEIDAKTGMVKTKSTIETAWNNLTNWFGSTAKNNLSAATKSATEGVKDSISPVVKEEIDNAKTYAENALNNLLGVFQDFSFKIKGILNASNQEISRYGANGMPTNVIKNLYGGTAVYAKDFSGAIEKLNDSIKVNGDGILKENYLLKDAKEAFEEATEGVSGFGDAIEESGDKAGKAGASIKDFMSTVKDTITNQLDMFTKFDMKTGVTAEQMLENMRSNIDGFASWSHRMSVLAERFAEQGIDKGLYEKLAEMGPKGYETMNAFYQMSEEQLAQVKDLWATGLTLPDSQASIIGDGYKYIGEMMVNGVSSALDDHKKLHASIHGLNKSAQTEFKNDWGIHSPSKVTEGYGVNMLLGIVQGLNDQASQSWLIANIHSLCTLIQKEFTNPEGGLSAETFKEVGTEIMNNLVESVFTEGGLMSVKGFTEAFLHLEEITEAITNFCNYVKQLFTASFLIPVGEGGEVSYSMVFYNYGLSMIDGIRQAYIDETEPLLEMLREFCRNIKQTFIDEWEMGGEDGGFGRSEVFYQIGINAMQGLLEGIEEKGAEAIEAAENIAMQVAAAMRMALDINSPSRVMRKIGNYVGEGFVLGITDGATPVYNAAKYLAEEGEDAVRNSMGRIQDAINLDMDLNPIITPMLDLTYLRNQMNEIDSLFAQRELALIAQNEGGSTGTYGSGATINYTQNNYSPKALSQVEIYRQTQNQLSTIRRVVNKR